MKMKILMIHNRYQQRGGEDTAFESEAILLEKEGHLIEQLIFDNTIIQKKLDKILSGFRGIYNPASAAVLQKKIKAFNPDIIHVHNFFPIASPSIFFIARKYNVPVVFSLHNYRLICPSAMLYHRNKIYERSIHSLFPVAAILRRVYRNSMLQTAAVTCTMSIHNLLGTWKNKVDRFIVMTDFARKMFINSALRISPEQLAVIQNFSEDFGTGNSEREDFFLYVGRLSEEKGIDCLLETAQKAGFNLTIIGDGPMRDKVMSYAKANPAISYRGFQPKEVIIDYLKRCKALLLCSIWYEGLPFTIMEAFSTGTPVIASRLGAMEESIEDGYNGLLFTPGDTNDLERTIRRFEHSSELQKEISLQTRKTYEEKYTPQIHYRLLMDVYTKVIQENRHE